MKTTLLLITTLLSSAIFAQDMFTLSTYTSAYTEVVNDTPVDLDNGGQPWDDPEFVVPFGFDFEIGGETFNAATQVGYGAFMAFGEINDIFNGQVHVFGSFEDLIDGASIDGLTPSQITYAVVGEPGNKIAKIQYKDAAFYEEVESDNPGANNRMDLQLWIYENGGILELHYGESTIPDPVLAYYGNPGPVGLVGLNYDLNTEIFDYGLAVAGEPENPTPFLFTDIWEEFDNGNINLNTTPESGRVYRFTPSVGTGIYESKIPEFSIYPTIAQSEIWVKDVHEANAAYHIVDITGKEVQTGKLQTSTSLNVASLTPGVYLLSIDGMGNAAKFIKK